MNKNIENLNKSAQEHDNSILCLWESLDKLKGELKSVDAENLRIIRENTSLKERIRKLNLVNDFNIEQLEKKVASLETRLNYFIGLKSTNQIDSDFDPSSSTEEIIKEILRRTAVLD